MIAEDWVVRPTLFASREILQEAVLTILCNYMDKFYRVSQERWDSENMVYKELDAKDPNFQDYKIKILRSEDELISAIKKLIEEGEKVYKQEKGELPRIHFDRHLYQPLLIERGERVKSSPPGLNESEQQFIRDIRQYVTQELNKSLASKEVFLLRNLNRGKGIGFFEKRGFYPDFILWIKEGESQRIVFIEPHGMMHAEAYKYDEKARLHERLPSLAKSISGKCSIKNVTLDSFIISATPFDDLHRKYEGGAWNRNDFMEAHILFPEINEEYNYIAKLFE